MNTKMMTAAVVSVSALAFSGNVGAQVQVQDKDAVAKEASEKDFTPATHAVELTIGTGYEQGVGKFSSDHPSLTDIGEAGGAVQVGVGYRIIPQLTLGLYASGAMFGRGGQVDSSAKLYSSAAGIQTDWHFLPGGHELDPWVSLSSGWWGYWIDQNEGKTSVQGMELAKLQVGVDYRIDRAVSISPVLGADLSAFFSQSTPESGGFRNISNPQVNTFVFAGMMGRFDIPTQANHSEVAAR